MRADSSTALRRRRRGELRERAACPRELLRPPAVERGDRDALVRRVDEPAAAEVDRRVVDLGRLRARAARAEEEHVRRLQLGERDPLRARVERNLAVLLVATGRADEASTRAENALVTHEQTLGRTHHWTIDSAITYAEALTALDRGDEAAEIRAAYRGSDAGASAAS